MLAAWSNLVLALGDPPAGRDFLDLTGLPQAVRDTFASTCDEIANDLAS